MRSKREVGSREAAKTKADVEFWEKAIDATLDRGERTITGLPPLAARPAIKQLYEAGGWKVEFCDDQRDGSWTQLS